MLLIRVMKAYKTKFSHLTKFLDRNISLPIHIFGKNQLSMKIRISKVNWRTTLFSIIEFATLWRDPKLP